MATHPLSDLLGERAIGNPVDRLVAIAAGEHQRGDLVVGPALHGEVGCVVEDRDRRLVGAVAEDDESLVGDGTQAGLVVEATDAQCLDDLTVGEQASQDREPDLAVLPGRRCRAVAAAGAMP